MTKQIDWKKNNKIVLRNPSNRAFHAHELIKTAIVLALRLKHRNSHKEEIHTEREVGDRIADIWFRNNKGEIYVYEIQEKETEAWRKKTEEFYLDQGVTPIIVPIKEFSIKLSENMIRYLDKSHFEAIIKTAEIYTI